MTKTLKSMLIEDIAKEKDPEILEWLKKQQRIMDYRESVIQELKGKEFGPGWGLIADFIIQREEAMLDAIQSSVEKVRNEIVDEISKQPQCANVGKKGCVARINNEIIPI